MRRIHRARLLTLAALATTTLAATSAKADTWTVLTYVYADNNLEAEAVFNLKQMMKVGTTGNLKVVAQVDRSLKYSQDQIPGVANFSGTKRMRIDPGTAVELQDMGKIDNTSAASIADFIKWGVQTYPSDHYALVLWDHGSGWKGCCEDEDSPGKDWTPLPTMVSGIQTGLSQAGKTQFDLLGFDECLMGSIEVAHSMSPYAKVMVGSAETEPGQGWDYEPFLKSITGNPAVDPITVGKAITDGYKAQNGDDDQITFSVIDLSKVPALVTAVDALSDTAGPAAAVRDSWMPMARSRANAEKYADSGGLNDPLSAVDLGGFISGIQGQGAYSAAADAASTAYKAAIPYHIEGAAHAKHTGLSIHLPQKGANVEYATIGYATTHWPGFLGNYSIGSGSDPNPPGLDDPQVTPPNSSSSSTSSSSSSSSGGNGTIPTIFGPINLGTVSPDDDLNIANLFLSQAAPDGSQKFMGALPATIGTDGSINAPFDGKWPMLTDGTTEGSAPFFQIGTFKSKGGGDNVMLAMVGDVMDSGGAINPGVVLFRYDPSTRNANVMRAYTFDLTRGYGQFDITKGGAKIRPYDLTVAPIGLPIPQAGDKVYDGATLAMKTRSLPKGQYSPGFLVSDLSGNIATKQIPVMVDVPDDGTGTGDGGTTDPNSHANGANDDTRSLCVVSSSSAGSDALLIGGALFGLAMIRGRRKKK